MRLQRSRSHKLEDIINKNQSTIQQAAPSFLKCTDEEMMSADRHSTASTVHVCAVCVRERKRAAVCRPQTSPIPWEVHSSTTGACAPLWLSRAPVPGKTTAGSTPGTGTRCPHTRSHSGPLTTAARPWPQPCVTHSCALHILLRYHEHITQAKRKLVEGGKWLKRNAIRRVVTAECCAALSCYTSCFKHQAEL